MIITMSALTMMAMLVMIIMSPHCARSQSEFKLWTGCAVFTYTQHSECPSLVNFMFMWHPMNKEMAKLRHKCVVLDTSSSFLFGEKLFLVFLAFYDQELQAGKAFQFECSYAAKSEYSRGDSRGRSATSVTRGWINLGIWLQWTAIHGNKPP